MIDCVVFVDSRVPDLRRLLDGLAPGSRAHVLSPSRDGLGQIADILAAEGVSDLSTLALVGHGRPGAIELGATTLDAAVLGERGEALARIAAALAPRADVLLYACDLASGSAGRRFLTELSRAFGGAVIAAASHPVGSDKHGGSWVLDAATGPAGSPSPFTAAARAAYEGTLAVKFTSGTTAGDPIGDTGSTDGRVLFGDFNGDGKLDVLTQFGADGAVSFRAGNGNGTFVAPISAGAANSPFSNIDFTGNQIAPSTTTTVIDIDQDSDLDIVLRDNDNYRILYKDSDGKYRTGTTAGDAIGDTGSVDSRVFFGDFNGDGKLDVLSQFGANGAVSFRAGNGNGTFAAPISAGAANSPFSNIDFTGNQLVKSSTSVIDIDQDGDLDIVLRDTDNYRILYKDSDGKYRTGTTAGDAIGDTGSVDSRVFFGDFNSDGKLDVLSQFGASGAVSFRAGNGNGTFAAPISAGAANSPFSGIDFTGNQLATASTTVIDIDQDSDLDIVLRDNDTYRILYQASDSGGDNSPPTLVSSSPTDNATGVAPAANITVTFDESVTKGSGTIEIVRISTGAVVETIAVGSANVTGSGRTWTINPTNDLQGGVEYGVRIVTGTFVDSDGAVYSGNPASAISFTTVANTAPTQTSNTGSTVLEGGTDTVTSTELRYTDAEQAASAVTYTVTSAVTNGTLFKNGATLGLGGTFTQDDINNNLITYAHDGGETTSASFGFAVSDGQGASLTGQTFTFAVTPVNDRPTFSATGATATFTEGADSSLGQAVGLFSNAAVSTVETGQTVKGFTVSVSGLVDGADEALVIDGTTIALADGASTTAGNGLTYTVTVAGGSATVMLTGGTLSAAAAAGIVNGITYVNLDADDPTAGTRTVTVSSLQDSGGTANGGADTATGQAIATVTVTPVDDAPVLSPANGLAGYTEGAAASTLAPTLTLTDPDSPTFTRATVVLNDAAVGDLLSGGTFGAFTGSYDVGTATLTITGPGTRADLEAALQTVSFASTSDDPTAGGADGSRNLTITAYDGNVASNPATVQVTVTGVEDAPTLTATAADPTFTEGAGLGMQGSAVALFTGATVDTVEANQTVTGLTLTVSGLADGANEVLVAGGTAIALTDGNASPAGAALGYSVSVGGGGVATVTLTPSVGLSEADAALLVTDLSYSNTNVDDPTAGTRTVAITSVIDSGGGTATLSGVGSTVTVVPVNDAPTASATGLNPTFTEGAGPGVQGSDAVLFSAASVGTIEASQTVTGLTFTIMGLQDGPSEVVRADGTAIVLSDNASGTTLNGLDFTVSIIGDTATVTLTSASGLSAGAAAALIEGLAYRNTNTDNPTAGTRTVTLTGLRDSGGGTDTVTLSIGSSVTVTPVNDGPVAADNGLSIDQRQITSGDNVLSDFSGRDTDPEGDSLAVTAIAIGGTSLPVAGPTVIAGAYGTLTISPDGTYAYDARTEGSLAVGETQVDDFTYTVRDGGSPAQTATAHLRVSVTGSPTGDAGANLFLITTNGYAVDGQGGTDTASFASRTAGVRVSLDGGNATAVFQGNTQIGTLAGIETVIGGSGDDSFSGTGSERFEGGRGNDTYFVNSNGDKVIEARSEGRDTIYSSLSYTLNSSHEIEVLRTGDDAGTDAIDLTGNRYDQLLVGNAGENVLNGRGGADVMTGLGGSDSYYVDDRDDQVVEAGNGGTDVVRASVNYALGTGQEIEELRAATKVATTGLTLTGNEFANKIVGNNGANVLNGRGGADALYGEGGNDTYHVDDEGDLVFEGSGDGTDLVLASASFALGSGQEIEELRAASKTGTAPLALTGNEIINKVVGNAGANVLNGKGGADLLYGLSGQDTFVFDTALGSGNVDRIADFSGPDDTIQLARSVFTALGAGPLTASAFKDVSTQGPVDGDDRIVYSSKLGTLSYDADGSGKAFQAVQFATIDTKVPLTHADFFVV